MEKAAIIIVGDGSMRLPHLQTSAPFALVGGHPIVARLVEQLQEADFTHLCIVADGQIDSLRQMLSPWGDRMSISFCEGAFSLAMVQALRKFSSATLVDADLFFEANPFMGVRHAASVELWVDKHLELNQFSGAQTTIHLSFMNRICMDDKRKPNATLLPMISVDHAGSRALIDLLETTDDIRSLHACLARVVSHASAKIAELPKMSWYKIGSSESLMRAEMLFRRQLLGERLTKVEITNLVAIPGQFSFSFQKSATTQIVVERGVTKRLGKLAIMDAGRVASNHIIITEEHAYRAVGRDVYAALQEAGYSVTLLIAPTGEAAKRIGVYQLFAEKIIAIGIDERSVIFSVGGGAVANLAGFLAATLYRGIGLIHIPTTILCMLDVAISLKQGINGEKGKNLVGSYYQPLAVFIDPEIPLTDKLVAHGLSEAIKHALTQDRLFYDFLMTYDGRLTDVDFLEAVIRKTIALKLELMEEDLHENKRAIALQYGHEIGHAIELLSGYQYTHGEAISIGMRCSAELAHCMGVAPPETVQMHCAIFQKYGLPYAIPKDIRQEAIIDALLFNKKTRGKDMMFALLEFVGKLWKIKGAFGIPCSPELIAAALKKSYDLT